MKRALGRLPEEVFLSHSSKDRGTASQIAQVLREHGVPVWYSETNLVGAKQWHDEIGAALKRCDWFLLLLSKDSERSQWVKRELLYALRSPQYEERIVPIKYRPCNAERLSWTLDDLQMVDMTGNFHKAYRALLRIWGLGYKKPQSLPRRPKLVIRLKK